MSPEVLYSETYISGGTNLIGDDLEGKCTECLKKYSEVFEFDNWLIYLGQERRGYLEVFAAEIARILYVPLRSIIFFEGVPYQRGYFNRDGSIHVNIDVLTNPNNMVDALDTIVHELRHGFQYKACWIPGFCGISEEQAKEWRDNFRFYITLETNMMAYFNQPVEKDARLFAENVIKSVFEEAYGRI